MRCPRNFAGSYDGGDGNLFESRGGSKQGQLIRLSLDKQSQQPKRGGSPFSESGRIVSNPRIVKGL
jgi:hypothetical protein